MPRRPRSALYTLQRLLKGQGGEDHALAAADAAHGESPLWLPDAGRLLVLDCPAAMLLVIDPETGEIRRLPLPEPCFWIVACRAPGHFLAGFRRRIVELRCDLVGAPEMVRELYALPARVQGVRFNDAKVGPSGQLYTGTMDENGVAPIGVLYQLDTGGGVRQIDDGYTIPNGPAFSACGNVMYQADSAAGTIYAYELAPDGRTGARRVHLRFGPEDGSPDGMCCDTEGGLWIAHWGAARVTRFRMDGTADRTLRLPPTNPTSVAFFGSDLTRLAVTSAVHGQRWRRTGGEVYAIEPGFAGKPATAFG